MKIIVVGGGASGLARAYCRAKKGHKVTVVERASACGKKLLATGNGRCNYFNSDMSLRHFHSSGGENPGEIITAENLDRLKNLYSEIGIVPTVKDGYWYPRSQQAVTVLNSLKRACKTAGAEIVCDTEITDISNKDGKFLLNGKFYADKVIICTGSPAYYKKENCLTYDFAKKFGHRVHAVKPALVRLCSDDRILKTVSGVRTNGEIALCDKNGVIRSQNGEIQFTDYGVSGICTMILSREYQEGVFAQINLVGDLAKTAAEFKKFFAEYGRAQNCTVGDILDSVLNYKLSNAVCSRLKISPDTPFFRLDKRAVDDISKEVTAFRLNITGTKGFDFAQTASGGVSLCEIDSRTMQSKKQKGLYFCGEALDLDGDCGGYNLTAAFLTGMLAGESV